MKRAPWTSASQWICQREWSRTVRFFTHRFVHGLCLNANLHPVKLSPSTPVEIYLRGWFRWNIENPVSSLMRRRYFNCGSVHLEERYKLPRGCSRLLDLARWPPPYRRTELRKDVPALSCVKLVADCVCNESSSHINMTDQSEQSLKGDHRIGELLWCEPRESPIFKAVGREVSTTGVLQARCGAALLRSSVVLVAVVVGPGPSKLSKLFLGGGRSPPGKARSIVAV